jgi:hypothetical protein
MSGSVSLLDWCRAQRAYMAQLRDEYRAGRRQIGQVVDGAFVNETDAAIIDLERRIADLDRFLAQEESNARRSS